MIVEIENNETGESDQLEVRAGESVVLPRGWRVKLREILQEVKCDEKIIKRVEARQEKAATMAAMISGWHLPLASSLTAVRWLLGRTCPYCEVAGEFLRLLEQGNIDEDEARKLVVQVLNAKDQQDEATLQELRGKLEILRIST